MSARFSPTTDGLDHINIYSRGRTPLGRMMSNFARHQVETRDGWFSSIEAYWYWLGTGLESLRRLSGPEAKARGQEYLKTHPKQNIPDFELRIVEAIFQKVETMPGLKPMLRDSALPFAHYYVFDGVAKDAGHRWLVQLWEDIRADLKR